MSSSNYSVYAPDAIEPWLAALGQILFFPADVAWVLFLVRRAKKERGAGSFPVLALLGFTFAVSAGVSVLYAAYSALYLQCDTPYVYRDPGFHGGRCVAMAYVAAANLLIPIGCSVFILASLSRFFKTVKALGERAATRVLRCARLVAGLVTALKLVAWGMRVAEINVASDSGSFAGEFNVATDLVFYTAVGCLEALSIALGLRYVYGTLREASSAVNREWLAKTAAPVRTLKRRERRLLLFAVLMLACNVANFVTFALQDSGLIQFAGVHQLFLVLLHMSQLRMFIYFEMFAINAMVDAIRCNNEAALLCCQRTTLINSPTVVSDLATEASPAIPKNSSRLDNRTRSSSVL